LTVPGRILGHWGESRVTMAGRLANRSPLELGALVALVTFGIAAVLGVVAVIDTDQVASGFGVGFGVAFVVFLAGATVVCALACLGRSRAELVALAAIVVTGIALDLLVLAIWLEIDSEWYGKTVGIGLAWAFFALLAFGLMLAVTAPGRLARWPFFVALATIACAGLITSYLVVTAGNDDPEAIPLDESTGFYFIPGVDIGDDELLRVLGLAFVLIATMWFGAIAAHRYEQSPRPGA
jgi:hypothetical protein